MLGKTSALRPPHQKKETLFEVDTRHQSFGFLSVGKLKTLVCAAAIENEETLYQRILYVCQTIRNRLGRFTVCCSP
jgi:hypothetical protein